MVTCAKQHSFFFLFVLDLGDAIFDTVLAVQEIYYRSDGSGSLGIFFIIMTFAGRLLSGVYGGGCGEDG